MSDREKVINDQQREIEELEERLAIVLEGQPEIVRCKDCNHRDPEDHKCDCGHDIQWQLPRADDWFCADGIRK
jgi:hypothetical protein